MKNILKIIVVIINELAKNYRKTYKNLWYFFYVLFSYAIFIYVITNKVKKD
jgi:hypothetical protein